MSKKRPKTPQNRPADPATIPREPAWPLSAVDARGTLAAGLLAVGFVVYGAWFFSQPLDELARNGLSIARSDFFLFWLTDAPAVWADRWFGDSGAAFVDRLPIAGIAALILGVAWAAGRILLRVTRADVALTQPERFALATAAGLNLVSLGMLLLGLAGWQSRTLLLVIAVSVVAVSAWIGWRDRWRSQPVTHIANSEGDSRRSHQALWLCWLAVPFAIVICLGGMLPASDFDVREYHLQAPKEFFLAGRISFVPHNVYANMPLGTELHSLLGMILLDDWWSGALVGKTMQASFALLTALLLCTAGCRWYSKSTGIIAAVIYLSTPWIVHVATAGLVEAAAACYAFATLYAWMLWREASQTADDHAATGRLLLCGFLAGSAVATKYPAALFVVLPSLGLVLWSARAARFRCAVLFLSAVAIGCGPWLAKNLYFTGNPTYPLLYTVFGGGDWTPEQNAQWRAAHRPPNYALVGRAAARASTSRNLASSLRDVLVASPWLNFVTWPLAIAALILARRDGLVLLLAIYIAFVLATWWLFTHRIDRFWIPLLPAASLLAGIGATCRRTRAWLVVTASALFLALIYDFAVVATNTGPGSSNRFLVPLATLRNDPERITPWVLWLNQHTPAGKKVLSEGDAQVFDLAMPVVYHTAFDASPLLAKTEGRTATERRAALADVAFVYVNWSEIARYRSPGNYGYTERMQPAILAELVDQGVLGPPLEQFRPAGVEIYPVRPAPQP